MDTDMDSVTCCSEVGVIVEPDDILESMRGYPLGGDGESDADFAAVFLNGIVPDIIAAMDDAWKKTVEDRLSGYLEFIGGSLYQEDRDLYAGIFEQVKKLEGSGDSLWLKMKPAKVEFAAGPRAPKAPIRSNIARARARLLKRSRDM